MIFRNEDLDSQRCTSEFAKAAIDDLRWLGISWDEGPDCGGPHAPYDQSKRTAYYLEGWERLKRSGHIYPCRRSRKDVAGAAQAPHENAEPIFPASWRAAPGTGLELDSPTGVNWRFRVPDGETIRFQDGRCGTFSAVAGADFGDFLVWRRDGVPAYELAVVIDDLAMQITEVIRGEDLLLSTCRQLLLYRAFGAAPPAFFHTPLLVDEAGNRLAKRNKSLSIQTLRQSGSHQDQIFARLRHQVGGGF